MKRNEQGLTNNPYYFHTYFISVAGTAGGAVGSLHFGRDDIKSIGRPKNRSRDDIKSVGQDKEQSRREDNKTV